jgi:hypothetical protein
MTQETTTTTANGSGGADPVADEGHEAKATDSSATRTRKAPVRPRRATAAAKVLDGKAPPPAVNMPPSALHPWKRNAKLRKNRATVPEVMASIQRFGFGRPVVARKANLEIIAGHVAWEAATRLGMAVIPVRLLDLSEREAHALALQDNKLGELSGWDEGELDAELADYDDKTQALFDDRKRGASAPSGDRDPLEVEEIDVTTAIGAQFWLNVRGPLTGQPDALARLQKALKGLQGIEVESGMVE